MTFLYIICFLLLAVGVILLLGLNPEIVTGDIMRLLSKKQSLHDKTLTARGKKKSKKLTAELIHIRDALESTGKGAQFSLACAASLVLIIIGCVVAVAMGNPFLIPVLAVAFAMIPFIFVKRTIAAYEKQVKEELETALSIITTSYVRSDSIVDSVKENLPYLRPPVREIFACFVAECGYVSADTKKAIRNLKDKITDTVFCEWCDVLLSCQDDRTLKDTLMPIVAKLTDVRIVNNDLKTMLGEVRREYYMMAGMLVANIPILYFINKDWYAALMYTTLGKIVLAVCGIAIIITAILMSRMTKPVEYKR